ncbi:prolyl oligopeptidase family serine peptidase [Lactococcus piscium]|nr:prolyl oligopeptidase family serine peptidase [Lactococcus carnosus]MBR6896140.1 prolyl oligopeptidase family serine peptidase [Lactococcus sp.]MCJ1975111.1 prolyl oligopeptidase family serine peptidase [Lactococcus carnosus]MCJ1985421.1 prolyl oligopeptidase family serine peptidase [Lactococcus carnosus]
MPPCFLWHTTEDPLVSVENSLKMSAVLQKNKIPFELHLYQRGVHGAALGDSRTSRNSTQNNPQAASWVNLLLGWLDGDSESIDKS